MGVLLVAFPEYALAVLESQCRVAASSCALRESPAGEAVGQFPRPCRPDQSPRRCRVHYLRRIGLMTSDSGGR